MSISWGKSLRIRFSGAWKLAEWTPPEVSAVYAITYKQDPERRPKSHTILYFGECDNLANQGLPWQHDRAELWMENVDDKSELYVFFHPMVGASKLERWKLHEQLVSEYRPVCNRP